MRVVGVIRRRLLLNFRVRRDAITPLLPAPFRPKLLGEEAVAGVCLIRLEHIRPAGAPALLGISSENAAHRIAVEWDEDGGRREGVYIPRRDTSSRINHLAGGRLFPGEHRLAHFDVDDDGDRIDLSMRSADGDVAVEVVARRVTGLPASSRFPSLKAASDFFAGGRVGYSATRKRGLDGVELVTQAWRVDPLEVESARSSFFDALPAGSVIFDCALIMRDVNHEWRPVPAIF